MNQIERFALEKVKLARRIHELNIKPEKVYWKKFDILEHQLKTVNEKLNHEIESELDKITQIARFYEILQIRSGHNSDMEWYHTHELIIIDKKVSPFDTVNKYVQTQSIKDEQFSDRVNKILGIGKYKKKGK